MAHSASVHQTQHSDGVPDRRCKDREILPQDEDGKGVIPSHDEESGDVNLSPLDSLIAVYNHPPFDLPRRAYLELVLSVGHLLDGSTSGEIYSQDVYRSLSSFSRKHLDPRLEGVGITCVCSVPSVLTIREQKSKKSGRWVSKPSLFTIGPLGTAAVEALASLDGTKGEVPYAIDQLIRYGDTTHWRVLQNAEAAQAQGTGTGKDAGPGRATAGRRANDVTNIVFPSLFASAPRSRINGHCSLSKGDIVGVAPPNTVILERTVCGNCRTVCGNSGHQALSDGRKRRCLKDLTEAEIEDLKAREPLPSVPRYVLPEWFRDEVVDWRPVLGESPGLMAIFQLIISSKRRDEDYNVYDDFTGIPLWHKIVLGAFGYDSRVQASKDGVNAGICLELYRSEVDAGFGWTGWDSRTNRARLVDSHSIPQRLVHKAKKIMLSPKDFDDLVELIGGVSATRRQWKSAEREERFAYIESQEPEITPPKSTRSIQTYLNGLDKKTFSSGRYGVFQSDRLDRMVEAACEAFQSEYDRDQELRKIYWIGTFEQPLYLPCDRFPRLKADRHNQAMNLPKRVRQAAYDDRDYELDLSKAHLASYVAVAKLENLNVPVLEEYLQANLNNNDLLLEDGDLWLDLAAATDLEDRQAARTAVKKAYSTVYGSGQNNLLHEISMAYKKTTGGEYPERKEVEPLLSHPLMKELLSTRDQLEAIITSRGGLEDATGRFIPLSAWDDVKDKENRWRGVMAYVNASFEQEIMSVAFEVAAEERDRDARSRFTIWLYQADGFTVRMGSKASHSRQIERLKEAVSGRAAELGVPTELEVDYSGGAY